MKFRDDKLDDDTYCVKYESVLKLFGGNMHALSQVKKKFRDEKKLECERKNKDHNPNPMWKFKPEGTFD